MSEAEGAARLLQCRIHGGSLESDSREGSGGLGGIAMLEGWMGGLVSRDAFTNHLIFLTHVIVVQMVGDVGYLHYEWDNIETNGQV